MLSRHEPQIYLRQDQGDRFRLHHVILLLAVLAVLYVAGSAIVSLVGTR